MNAHDAIVILAAIDYEDGWWFFVSGHPDFYLQVRFRDDKGQEHRGRKWRLSSYMTKSELVQTALAAILMAEEHETREKFRYHGVAIFHPHQDVDELVHTAARVGDVRPAVR